MRWMFKYYYILIISQYGMMSHEFFYYTSIGELRMRLHGFH